MVDKESGLSSAAQSTIMNVVSCSSWGNSSESYVRQSPGCGGLSLNMGALNPYFHNKNLVFPFQDQDSTSSQSTGQSYSTVTSTADCNPFEQKCISAPSGYNETQEKIGLAQSKLASSIVTQDIVFPMQVDCSQPVARVPLPYAEQYFGGMVAVNHGSQAMARHPMMGMFPARVPLPLDLQEDEPIYVNAKQYQAILRRREYRARLEARNKLIKNRKPYLHESRHLHALKRARGAGGRFLNTKKLQESNPKTVSDSPHQPEDYRNAASTSFRFDVTIASHSDDIFHHHQDFTFSGYPSHIGLATQDLSGNMRGGQNLHNHSGLLVSVNRQS